MCSFKSKFLWIQSAFGLLVVLTCSFNCCKAIEFFEPSPYDDSQEKTAREVLSCGDAAFSIAGDAMVAHGKNQVAAGACKILGSLFNMAGSVYNPCMPKDVKSLRMASDAVRTLSYLPMLQDEMQSKEPEESKHFALSSILRLVSVGADWFAVQKEYGQGDCYSSEEEEDKKWALARLISTWSRAFADGLTAPVLGKTASYFSAVVDSYELLKCINPEWAESVHKANEPAVLQPVYSATPTEMRTFAPRLAPATSEETPDRDVNEIVRRFRLMSPGDRMEGILRELYGADAGMECCPICSLRHGEKRDESNPLSETLLLDRESFGMYPCGHTICKQCIRDWRSQNWKDEDGSTVRHNLSCPFCKQGCSGRQIVD